MNKSQSLCRHFGPCGGCLMQDMPADEYRALKRESVVAALRHRGIEEASVAEVISVLPNTRRRASFKVMKKDGVTVLGFHARQSHTIVDMHECRLLTPVLMAAVSKLRATMDFLLHDGEKAEIHAAETDTGLDVALDWKRPLDAALTATLARRAQDMKLARIVMNGETAVELARPTLAFGKAQAHPPPRAFLQPTREGERALQSLAGDALAGAREIADLFSGCGTFALPLAEKARVHAVEHDAAMLAALADAVRRTQGLKPVTTERRDLFKLPLSPPETKRFDAAVLDPPRAGAHAQAKALAASKIRRIVYVSCNPESFARDARVLIAAGFRMGIVTPVDQFLWSSHIELVAAFERR